MLRHPHRGLHLPARFHVARAHGEDPLDVDVEGDLQPRFAGAPKYTLSRLTKLALDGLFNFSSYPLRLITLLLPSDDPFASPPDVFPIMGKQDGLVGLAFAGGESVRLDAAGDLLVHFPGPGAAEAS